MIQAAFSYLASLQTLLCTAVRQATAPLLERDPTIWCVSSWNDNGQDSLDWDARKLVRPHAELSKAAALLARLDRACLLKGRPAAVRMHAVPDIAFPRAGLDDAPRAVAGDWPSLPRAGVGPLDAPQQHLQRCCRLALLILKACMV